MENSELLRQEVSKMDKKMLARKLKEKKISIGTLNRAISRGKLSLGLAIAMGDISGMAVNFWQAPGLYKTDGDFI